MPAPLTNFDGLSNIDGALRPDTSGDVGPNHYMQWINLSFAIYNKQGAMVYGPAAGTTLFPNSSVCGTRNGGDPVILYDQFANRWFATQSAYENLVDGPYYQCVAVSQTSDPTGAWCGPVPVAHDEVHRLREVRRVASQNAYMMTSPQYYRAASFSGIRRLGVRAEPAPLVRQCARRLPRHGLAGSDLPARSARQTQTAHWLPRQAPRLRS